MTWVVGTFSWRGPRGTVRAPLTLRAPAGYGWCDVLGAVTAVYGGGLNSPWLRPPCGPGHRIAHPVVVRDLRGRLLLGGG